MGALLGYARVSTLDQDQQLQVDALNAAGCIRVWTDQASGAREDRPELAAVLEHLRDDHGDTLVVWKLDRLGRSMRHLVELVDDLTQRGIGLRVLQDGIDTTTPAGRMFLGIMASLAEFEAELIRERTHAGLAAARARGRQGGRPAALDATQVKLAKQMREGGENTMAQIAAALSVSRSTVYRALAAPVEGTRSPPTLLP